LGGSDRVPFYVSSQQRGDVLDGTILLQNATFIGGGGGGGGSSGLAR